MNIDRCVMLTTNCRVPALPTDKAYYYYNLLTPPLPGIAVATAIGRTTNGCHVHIPRYNILVGLRAPEDSWTARLNTTYFFPPRYNIVVKSLFHGAGQFRPKWPGGPSKILTDSWPQRWDPVIILCNRCFYIYHCINFKLHFCFQARPPAKKSTAQPAAPSRTRPAVTATGKKNVPVPAVKTTGAAPTAPPIRNSQYCQ